MFDPALVARALTALGHEARLSIFRLLVRAGCDGLTVGAIAQHVGLPPSTLAHHLRKLTEAGLVLQEGHGRTTVNRADFAVLKGALAYLTAECCRGVSLVREDAT
ncbi:metalloregulator ArsR/SmtB family transcription factor [Jannaschia sp. LMIT008]|uniref:ArsR/SmtB family transcription factor n=1 Tax=Jannaschia maritima TaxID=3032585 RepID=UPI0028118DE5|nr:metalloregulator ArsR/SmtB family transcription factor [Jannaschia sp. LMIT008]